MSNVLSIIKVFPTSPEVDREDILSKAKTDLTKGIELEILKYEEEPLFFGLVALKLFVKTVDSEEGNEVLEKFQQLCRIVFRDSFISCLNIIDIQNS